jgi:sec-independent protein translocase protein TatA
MGSMSIGHWLVVAVVVLIFFGRGKIPELMGDIAKGIKSFKKGMREDEQADDAKDGVKKEIEQQAVAPAPSQSTPEAAPVVPKPEQKPV